MRRDWYSRDLENITHLFHMVLLCSEWYRWRLKLYGLAFILLITSDNFDWRWRMLLWSSKRCIEDWMLSSCLNHMRSSLNFVVIHLRYVKATKFALVMASFSWFQCFSWCNSDSPFLPVPLAFAFCFLHLCVIIARVIPSLCFWKWILGSLGFGYSWWDMWSRIILIHRNTQLYMSCLRGWLWVYFGKFAISDRLNFSCKL